MTTYSGDNATGAITTNYFYNWYTNSSGDQTNNPEAVVTIQPAVAAGQNDTGVNSVEIEWMDQQGNVEWQRDANGRFTYNGYDSFDNTLNTYDSFNNKLQGRSRTWTTQPRRRTASIAACSAM